MPDQSSNLSGIVTRLSAMAAIAVFAGCTTHRPSPVEIPSSAPAPAAPDPSRAVVHADTAHGVVIPDEYRWLENAGDEDLDRWIDAEDGYGGAVIASLPRRASLRARIAELWRSGAGAVDEKPS